MLYVPKIIIPNGFVTRVRSRIDRARTSCGEETNYEEENDGRLKRMLNIARVVMIKGTRRWQVRQKSEVKIETVKNKCVELYAAIMDNGSLAQAEWVINIFRQSEL